jgi:hypothetical protein
MCTKELPKLGSVCMRVTERTTLITVSLSEGMLRGVFCWKPNKKPKLCSGAIVHAEACCNLQCFKRNLMMQPVSSIILTKIEFHPSIESHMPKPPQGKRGSGHLEKMPVHYVTKFRFDEQISSLPGQRPGNALCAGILRSHNRPPKVESRYPIVLPSFLT